MFDVERFAEECTRALSDPSPRHAIRDLVAQAVANPGGLTAALGEPRRPGIYGLRSVPGMTIVQFVWGPGMVIRPHDHGMWAVIGVYSGREDNILWRRLADDPAGRIEAAGALSLGAGTVTTFGRDAVHSVVNPLGRMTTAIHVYGGDFFHRESSEWSPEDLTRAPFDMDRTRADFDRAARLMDTAPA